MSLIGGIDDQKSVELYIEKLQSLSEHQISPAQKYLVAYNYINLKNRNPNKTERRKARKKFNAQKPQLKKQWSEYYSLKWPVEYADSSNQSAKSPKNFEAHHIIPINSGGVNQLWNITPLSSRNHKELHASIEEHACFSHDFFEKKFCRFALKLTLYFEKVSNKISDLQTPCFQLIRFAKY